MGKFNQTAKQKITKGKIRFYVKRKTPKRKPARLISSRDRLSRARLIAARPANLAPAKRFQKKYFAGPIRQTTEIFRARLIGMSALKLTPKTYVASNSLPKKSIGKKYRLKLILAVKRAIKPIPTRLSTFTMLRRSRAKTNNLVSRRRLMAFVRVKHVCQQIYFRKLATRQRRKKRVRRNRASWWRRNSIKRKKTFWKILRKLGVSRRRWRLRGQRIFQYKSKNVLLSQLKRFKVLTYRRLRKKRKGTKTFKTQRWWWPRGIKRHRRRNRKMFANELKKKARWRLARRDPQLLKRALRSYQANNTAIGSSIVARRDMLARRSHKIRSLVVFVRRAPFSGRAAVLKLPAVFKRVALRRLAEQQKKTTQKTYYLQKSASRIDAQSNKLRTARRPHRISAALISDNKFKYIFAGRRNRRLQLTQDSAFIALRGYRAWKTARRAIKLRNQRQLRSGSILGSSHAEVKKMAALATARLLLYRRGSYLAFGSSRIFGSRTLRKVQGRGRFFKTLSAVSTIYAQENEKQSDFFAPKPWRAPGALRLSKFRRPGFISKSLKTIKQKYIPKVLTAQTKLTRARQHYRQLQTYHNRPKLRLPNTKITRSRKRRSGLTTFARNSLRRPRTLDGERARVLPPVTVYGNSTKMNIVGQLASRRTVFAYERSYDMLPVFWKRPHNRANSKAVDVIRRKRYRSYRNYYKSVRAEAYYYVNRRIIPFKGLPKVSAKQNLTTLLEQKIAGELTAQKQLIPSKQEILSPFRKTLRFSTKSRSKNVKKSQLMGLVKANVRTLRHLSPLRSRLTEVTALQVPDQSITARKAAGLLHARSVRAMLFAERTLSAWAPQLSARNRRKYYPRAGFVPERRKRLTFRKKRIRRVDNAWRLRHNIPQIRYTDHTRVKLQYFFGSVHGAGYMRARRVYRTPSVHNRWWQPTFRPSPFAHPYSRRDLNATHYSKVAFLKTIVPSTNSFINYFGPTPGLSLHTKFPPRLIPWRNFRFRNPRVGKPPANLQRWTFTSRAGKLGRTAVGTSQITLVNLPRKVRNLHKVVSARGAYANRNWGLVDWNTLQSAHAAQFAAAVAAVPYSVWSAIENKCGSISEYTAVRKKIFDKFKAWIRKQQAVEPVFSEQTSENVLGTLVTLLRATIQNQISIPTNFTSGEQHKRLCKNTLSDQAKYKALQYLKLRELPSTSSKLAPEKILFREESAVYKRWLSGVEGMFKRTQANYTPTSRSRYTDNVSTTFGRRRPRFPGSGRRRTSYDSLLHAFAKKVAPAKFRRKSKLRFRWVRPQLSGDFQENISTLTPQFGANRRQQTAKQLSAVSYLSSGMRELLQHRVALRRKDLCSEIFLAGTKRRFLALPTHKIFKEQQKMARRAIFPYRQQMYSIRSGILRRALRRRRKERVYIDLRQSARQRRLPKDKAKSYWSLRRRRYPRRRHVVRHGKYSRLSMRKRSKTNVRWTLRHLSAVGPRRGRKRKGRLPLFLSHGEDVSIKKSVLRKRLRAIRGFQPPVSTRQNRRVLRRRARDSAKRKRRARRGRKVNQRRARKRVRHWSEKRLRRVRKNSYSYRRVVIAKNFARKIRGKFADRFSSTRLRRFSRLSRYFNHKASTAVRRPIANHKTHFPAAVLESTSSLQEVDAIWPLRQKSKFMQRRVRSYKLRGSLLRQRKLQREFDTLREQTTRSVPERLIESLTSFPVTTPLWFEPPVTRVVKSEALKEHEAAAAIAAKEESFQLPAQYVESVTIFLPELMNFIFSKRIKNKKVTYSTAKHAVRNIYWSLRVHLNVDPFDQRFFVKDKVPAARLRVFEAISDLSKFQKTLQPQRSALRYRLQTSRLMRAPNTARLREDWLRAFFPARHALYQENAEDYGKFLVATHRLRRLRIGPRGVQSWVTVPNRIGLETRARQLLKLKFSRRRKRFETVLQTTRRVAAEEPTPSKAGDVRSFFFSRQFSTYSNRGLALSTRWIHRQKRFVTLEDGWRTLTPASLVSTRSRLISRIEARGKTRYVTTDWKAITASLLDTRFARVKSPRSRQYLIRLPKSLGQQSKQKKRIDILNYKEILSSRGTALKKPSKLRWTRSRRSSWSSTFKPKIEKNSLAELRQKYILRRVQDALFARKKRSLHAVKTARSVLHYRTSQQRTSGVVYRKAPAIIPGGVFPLRRFLRMKHVSKALKAKGRSKGLLKLGSTFKIKWRAFPKSLTLSKAHSGLVRFGRHLRKSGVRRHKNYFTSSAGHEIARDIDRAKAGAMIKAYRRQTPFDTHRPKLWNKLTLQKMKKFRIGRYWMRDTTHWLRDPWLSGIVAPDMSLQRDRFGGELLSRQQQVGEYVPEVDAEGQDIARKNAPKERHKFQRIFPEREDPEIRKTDRILKHGSTSDKTIALHRLQIAVQARRKPAPNMWLANYEYRDVIREHKEEKAKSAKQKLEKEQARVKAYWARKAKRLPPIRPKRLPLKHPANLWLPHVIWKDIQRRLRKFEWRENDLVFARRGYLTAFRFRADERRKARWLEPLIYTRATYSTRLRSFRRRQFPHEQKKFKWLQRVRKVLYPKHRRKYIKRKRWSQLRRYNQKLHYSLFDLRDRGAARRHFKRLNGRTRPPISAFVSMSQGLTDRLDVTALAMHAAPTIYWARIVSEFGLLKVNGKTVYDPAYQLKPADIIRLNTETIARFQHYFQPYLNRRAVRRRRNKASTAFYPKNLEYDRGTRALVYKHAPDESDLPKYGRIRPRYFRWFKLDSV